METKLTDAGYVKKRLETLVAGRRSAKSVYTSMVRLINSELSRLSDATEKAALSGRPFAAYLSMEYLLGKLGMQTLLNLNAYDAFAEAVADLGFKIDDVMEHDVSTQLGNGGLGRLAACFFDSIATMRLPVFGYGLFYRCGIYKQEIKNGKQVEKADLWWADDNLAVRHRDKIAYDIGFGGRLDKSGVWKPEEVVKARARDIMLAGYDAAGAATVRLWDAGQKDRRPPKVFGDIKNITDFLYPPDHTPEGKRLRLRQEHVLVSASIADIFARLDRAGLAGDYIDRYVKIQLNDTHPALAVPEIIRVLMNRYKMSFDAAYKKMYRTCAYTNHTLMAEALEKIGTGLMTAELPAHMDIIKRIDRSFANASAKKLKAKDLEKTAVIHPDGYVNMGNLCMIATHKVNGVAALHSHLLKTKEFKSISDLYPGKFINETNGVTQRRWLMQANPRLAQLITDTVGDAWITDLSALKYLLPYRRDRDFLTRLQEVKYANKVDLFESLDPALGTRLDPRFMLDSQIKRIHEYKRQLLNVFRVISIYGRIRAGESVEPRVILFAGKAPPTYDVAKEIVALILDIADKVNGDPRAKSVLKVVFVPNYNIDRAEEIIAASDLSEQISTAGKEASGTGNMKFAMNGALTVGTMDGANVEIAENVGRRNMFVFGLTAPQVYKAKAQGYDPLAAIVRTPVLAHVIRQIKDGVFGSHKIILDALFDGRDQYMVCADFSDYMRAQALASKLYRTPLEWHRRALINIANTGFFSSDRTIAGYANDIWNVDEMNI